MAVLTTAVSTTATLAGPSGSWKCVKDYQLASGVPFSQRGADWNSAWGTGPTNGVGGVNACGTFGNTTGQFFGPSAIVCDSSGMHLKCISPVASEAAQVPSNYRTCETGFVTTAGLLSFDIASTGLPANVTGDTVQGPLVVEYIVKFPVYNGAATAAIWNTNCDNYWHPGPGTGYSEEIDFTEMLPAFQAHLHPPAGTPPANVTPPGVNLTTWSQSAHKFCWQLQTSGMSLWVDGVAISLAAERQDLYWSTQLTKPLYFIMSSGGTTTAAFGSELLVSELTVWIPGTPIGAAPAVTTNAAGPVGTTTATLNETVNPAASATSTYFQYGTTTSYGTQTATQDAGSGSGGVAVTQAITGLSPSTTYHYRGVATNSFGTTNGADTTFTTASGTGTSHVQETVAGNLGNASDTTFTISLTGVTAGHSLFLAIESGSAANTAGSGGFGVSDNVGGTWTNATPTVTGNYYSAAIYQCASSPGGSVTVTVTTKTNTGATGFPPDTHGLGMWLAEFSGTSAFDKNNYNIGTGPTASEGSLSTLASSGELILVLGLLNGKTPSAGPGGGWTGVAGPAIFGAGGAPLAWQVASSTTPPTAAAWTITSTSWATITATFPASTGAGVPVVSTNAASSIGSTTATLNGTYNPEGFATTANVQYGTTTSYGITGTGVSVGSGSAGVAQGFAITGLTAGTTYHFRATATNTNGTGTGADATFTTTPSVPVVATLPATAVTANGATFNGQVNPSGADTTYDFQYAVAGTVVFPTSATFPTTSTLDNFTRANENPLSDGGNWTTPATAYTDDTLTVKLVGNQAVPVSANYGSAIWNAATFASPEVWAIYPDVSNGPLLFACMDGAGNGYQLYFASTGPGSLFGISKIEGGGWLAQNTTTSIANGDGLGLSVIGGLVTAYHKSGSGPWTVTLQASDSTHTTGYIGFGWLGNATTGALSSFGGGAGAPTWATTGAIDVGSGSSVVAANAAVTGLTPNAAYVYRIAATNSNGTVFGQVQQVPLLGTLTATTGAAVVTAGSVTLNATINPNGTDTTAYFQYGSTTSYTDSTVPQDVGSAFGQTAFSQVITGVAGLTHFRVVALNSAGTVVGSDMTFSVPQLVIPPPTTTPSGTVSPPPVARTIVSSGLVDALQPWIQ